MNYMWLEKAIEIAIKAHRGQEDKAGEAYILHPLRVMLSQTTNVNRIVAVLHDVIEDAGIEYRQYIIDTGIDGCIIEALDCLTHNDGENYFDYIRRCKSNDIAKIVKLADLSDNMNVTRIKHPTAKDFNRNMKYRQAMEILLDIGE